LQIQFKNLEDFELAFLGNTQLSLVEKFLDVVTGTRENIHKAIFFYSEGQTRQKPHL